MYKLKILFVFLGAILLFITIPLSAQDGSLISEITAGNFFGVGARAMGMGGTHIASVLDGTALLYNPAALAQIRRLEFQSSLSHQRFDNNADPSLKGSPLPGLNNRIQSNTRFNGINVAYPYPTLRGRMVVAFGLNRIKDFDKTFKVGYRESGNLETSGIEVETGSLYALSAGGALEVSPRISVGGAVNYYFGSDDYNWQLYKGEFGNGNPLYVDFIENDYRGFSGKVGMLYSADKYFRFGLTIESPTYYQIEEKYNYRTYSDSYNYNHYYGNYDYDLVTPFSFGAGMALHINYVHLAVDLIFTDWAQMRYHNDPDLEMDNLYIQDHYREVLKLSFGGEVIVPKIGMKLRAGYMHDPLPYRNVDYFSPIISQTGFSYDIMKDRKFVTFGIGYLIDRTMTVDLGVALGGYEIRDNITSIREEIDLSRIYITTGFRM